MDMLANIKADKVGDKSFKISLFFNYFFEVGF